MPMTDPARRDEEAGNADLMAVYEKYGRTAAIAHERGGAAYVNARLAELNRIDDVYSQCQLLDQPLPEGPALAIFRFAYPKRGRSVS
jgi:hypothetical protein